MTNNPPIVVGIDGSEPSLRALDAAITEAGLRDTSVHVVYATDISPAVLHLPEGKVNTSEIAEASRENVWGLARERIESSDVSIVQVDRNGYPADEIVTYCKEVGAGLLVMGTRGRGRLASTILGSTSRRAVELAPCDVLIVKTG